MLTFYRGRFFAPQKLKNIFNSTLTMLWQQLISSLWRPPCTFSTLIWPILPALVRAQGLPLELANGLTSPPLAVATLLQSPQQREKMAALVHVLMTPLKCRSFLYKA